MAAGLGALALGALALVGAGPAPVDDLAIPVRVAPEVRGSMVAELTAAPFVPGPIDRDYPTKVVVNLEVVESQTWDVDNIAARTKSLAERAVKVWPSPMV